VIDVTDEGFLSLLAIEGTTRADLRLPDGELGLTIQDTFERDQSVLVTVQAAMGNEAVISCKAF
jgi:translation initiation factor 5A